VRDPEGEPLARVPVVALRVRFQDGRRKVAVAEGTFTDEAGQYHLTGLAPGRYYLRTDPKAKEAGAPDMGMGEVGMLIVMNSGGVDLNPRAPTSLLLPVFYPGALSPDTARGIDLEAGAHMTGMDLAVPRGRAVAVKGHMSVPEGSRPQMVALSRSEWMGESMDPRLTVPVDEHGDFTFPAVPQGSYTLTGIALHMGTPMRVRMPGQPEGSPVIVAEAATSRQWSGTTAVEVGTVPVEGVRITVSPGAEVTGHVMQAGDKGPAVMGNLVFDDGVSDMRRADVAPNGEFRVDLPPGQYQAYMDGLAGTQDGPALVMRSMTWGGRDIAAQGLTITGGEKVDLDVVVAPDGGKVEGTVTDKDDKPIGGATVVLIPEMKYRARADRYFQTDTDQYGHFSLSGVLSGDYKVLAWEDVEPGMWRDADFLRPLESSGVAVTMKTGGHETVKVQGK
jgi:hypothetical protein